MKKIFTVLVLLVATSGCTRNFNKSTAQNFTLGSVQMKVYRGMDQGAVAEALGSPNIVTKNADGQVTWIYDKIGTEVEYYERGGGFWLVIVGGGGSNGATRTSQRTLTAVVKFNSESKVENLTYHSSKF